MSEMADEDPWPKEKMFATLAASSASGQSERGLAVVLTTGGMNPLHRGHVALLHQASARLKSAGYSVIGAWLSPSHDLYLQPKAKSLKTIGLSAPFRVEAAAQTLASDSFISVGQWETSPAHRHWPDFPEVCEALQRELEGIPALEDKQVTVFYACGTDHAAKCGLYRGGRSWGVVVVPRVGDTPRAEKPDMNVYVSEPAQGDMASLSSTKVRAALEKGDHEFVAHALSPEAARFLLSPSAEELQQFSGDFKALGVKKKSPTSCSGTGGAKTKTENARHIYLSLSKIMRRFDTKGESMIQSIPSNSLFFFGSKRSWVFPCDEQELEESRAENRSYTDPKYQALRDLILEKEARGEVFFLKPPGFKYNGSLYHGDPNAFAAASAWLTKLDDPATGEKYKPLLLDEEWWRSVWQKASHKYTSHVPTIIKNFQNGAHDYPPVQELLYQSNPTLLQVL